MTEYQKAKNYRCATRKLREELRRIKKARNRKIRHSADYTGESRKTKGARDIV